MTLQLEPHRTMLEADDYTPRQQVALLARMLSREGYDDHHVGHISVRQPDDTLLVNPQQFAWDELCASDIMQIDLDGNIVAGPWDVTPAIELHLALHRRFQHVSVGVHHHPRYATIWAAAGRMPPAYDQFSCQVRDDRFAFLDEYFGGVNTVDAAERNIAALENADCALLSNHGVMVVAPNVDTAYLRAASLEWRCRLAWHVEALGVGRPMPAEQAQGLADTIDGLGGFTHLFSSMARKEIRLDPSLLL